MDDIEKKGESVDDGEIVSNPSWACAGDGDPETCKQGPVAAIFSQSSDPRTPSPCNILCVSGWP